MCINLEFEQMEMSLSKFYNEMKMLLTYILRTELGLLFDWNLYSYKQLIKKNEMSQKMKIMQQQFIP